jgi:hypothetical protein
MKADPADAPPEVRGRRASSSARRPVGATLLWLFVLAVMLFAAGVMIQGFEPDWHDPLALSMLGLAGCIGLLALWRLGVAWQPARPAAVSEAGEEKLVFARSLAGKAIAALSCAAITAAALFYAADAPGRTGAWIFGAVFGLLTAIAFGMAEERRPLVIDRDGISGTGWRGRPIPWSAIDKLVTYSIRGTPGIKLWLKAPGSYAVPPRFAAARPQPLRVVNIMPTTYATDTETLLEAFAQFRTAAETK